MKLRVILLVLLLALSIFIVGCDDAPLEPEDVAVLSDEQSNGGINALVSATAPFFDRLKVLVGGIFGLYFLLLVARIYYERKKVKLLQDIRYDLDRLNAHQGIRYSAERKTLMKRLIGVLENYMHIRRMEFLHKKSRKKKK